MSLEDQKLSIFKTAEKLAAGAADKFIQVANESLHQSERFSVALAGGKTPRRVYELLADEPFKNLIDWSRVHLFFGDERCVPRDHPESNYGMVKAALISKIPIPIQNVHRIPGEGDPKQSAEAYELELRRFFSEHEWPRFDLVLLGMGEDGHTASLFPNSAALSETIRWVVATRNDGGQDRITLTIPALNRARSVMFLVTGKAKAQRLREVLRPEPSSPELPVQLIKPVEGTLQWLVDSEAAALI